MASSWKFNAPGFRARIEESFYYGGADGARRSNQIVVYGSLKDTAQMRWHLTRYEGMLSENGAAAAEPALPL
jgi:uncharacterized heparinase superfamily protein